MRAEGARSMQSAHIEAGHRCAVCGAGRPLELAHIIAWNRSPYRSGTAPSRYLMFSSFQRMPPPRKKESSSRKSS